jgi:hypothetical protein
MDYKINTDDIIEKIDFKLKAFNNESHMSKFSKEDWKTIESIQSTSFEKMVNLCLLDLGNNEIKKMNETMYIVLGNNFYNLFRSKCKEYLVGETDEFKMEPKKMSKVDKIRFDNTIVRIQKSLDDLLISFKKDKLNYEFGLGTNKNIELRGITLMYIAKFVSENKIEDEIFEVYIGIIKFIRCCSHMKGKFILDQLKNEEISSVMIDDLNKWKHKLEIDFNINVSNIYLKIPRLIMYSKYDEYIPNNNIKPMDHQIKIMEVIRNNKNYLIAYNAMIGTGKTTFASVGLSTYVKKERIINSKLQLIICCNIPSVRLQVSHLLYENNIPFGVGYINDIGQIKIVNSFMCKLDNERIVIVCGTDVAKELLILDDDRLKAEHNESNYILFLDEPNVGADILESKSLLRNMELFKYLPDKTILSSATLPILTQLKEFLEYHKKRWNNIELFMIYSTETQVNCMVKNYDGTIILPHVGCRCIEELNKRLEIIKENPLFGRMYDLNVISAMCNQIGININEIIDEEMTATKIKNVGIKILENIKTDSLVKKICMMDMKHTDIDLTKLGTSDAYKLSGMTLIATENPIKFCKEAFSDLIKDILEKYKSIDRIIKKYQSNVEKNTENITKIEKMIKNKDELGKKIMEYNEDHKIELEFSNEFQINTQKHYEKYCLNKTDNFEFRRDFPLEIHPIMNVPKWVLSLLFSGIGLYSSGLGLTDQYYKHILNLASAGQLMYVIADATICYGTNYPFTNVIIDNDFGKNHSIQMIYQLMGRAGRIGKSWNANIYVDDKITERIIKYASGEIETIEIDNMNKIFHKLCEPKVEKTEIKNDSWNIDETEINDEKEIKPTKIIKPTEKITIEYKKEDEKERKYIKYEVITTSTEVKEKMQYEKATYVPPHMRKKTI